MSGELINVWGTPKTLEANGGAIANNAITAADDANYDQVADGASYPDGEFVLACAYATAPTENSSLELYARELDISGTNDADAPEASSYRPRFICAFPVNNVGSGTVQYIKAIGRSLPKLAAYSIYNAGTGQTVSAGWTLTVTPLTRKAAP
jgi:hypothetical protein